MLKLRARLVGAFQLGNENENDSFSWIVFGSSNLMEEWKWDTPRNENHSFPWGTWE